MLANKIICIMTKKIPYHGQNCNTATQACKLYLTLFKITKMDDSWNKNLHIQCLSEEEGLRFLRVEPT